MATLKIYIPYKNLPDSWIQVPCHEESEVKYEDVIFLDGQKFLDTGAALRYLVEQFNDTILAGRYLNSIKR